MSDNKTKGLTVDDDIKREVEDKLTAPQPREDFGNPVCPHCGSDPCEFAGRLMRIAKFQTLVVYCANPKCRKVLPLEVIGIDQPRISQATNFTGLHRP